MYIINTSMEEVRSTPPPPPPPSHPITPQIFKKIIESVGKKLKEYSLSKITINVSFYKRFSKNTQRLTTLACIDEINKQSSLIWKDQKAIQKLLKKGVKSHADRTHVRVEIAKHLFEINKRLELIKTQQNKLKDHALQPYIPKKFEENMLKIQSLVKDVNLCADALEFGASVKSKETLPPRPAPNRGSPSRPNPVTNLPPPPPRPTVRKPRDPNFKMPRFDEAPPPIQGKKTTPTHEMSADQAKKAEHIIKEWMVTSNSNIKQSRTFVAQMSLGKEMTKIRKHKLTNLWKAYQDLTNRQSEFNAKLDVIAKGNNTKKKIEEFAQLLESPELNELIEALKDYINEFNRAEGNLQAFFNESSEKITAKEGWTAREYLTKPVQALARIPLLTEPLIKAAPSMAKPLIASKERISNIILEMNDQMAPSSSKGKTKLSKTRQV